MDPTQKRIYVIVVAMAMFAGFMAVMLVIFKDSDPCAINGKCVVSPEKNSCGDGVCGDDESSETCAVDCAAPSAACGDGVCEDRDWEIGCALDCGSGGVAVSAGSSVVIYEQTGSINGYEFEVSDIMENNATFDTAGGETYTVGSDGMTLAISCYSDGSRVGTAVGGNLVAARLDGVEGYPDGIWASEITDYHLGRNGIAESIGNILGSDRAVGPYNGSLCTYLGNGGSRITVGFRTSEISQCGNGFCEDGENSNNCDNDCNDYCGDGVCGAQETAADCSRDCFDQDCQAVCQKKGYLYSLPECSSVNILAKFNIAERVTCCCANENRINTCGNGICQLNQKEDENNCPTDCAVTDNTCVKENEAIKGRKCCAGYGVKCGEIPMELPDGTVKMSLAGCWCVPVTDDSCGDGICGENENGYECPRDCPKIYEEESGCIKDADCGLCQSCSSGKCVNISTGWGDGSHGCLGSGNNNSTRCFQGKCVTCSGEIIYDSTARKYGCWYLADGGTSCDVFCGQKGCDEDMSYENKWGDDQNCTIGKKMTGCSKCSADYEDGWWVPYYNTANDTCYYYGGAGVYYSCFWGPQSANIKRICACEY